MFGIAAFAQVPFASLANANFSEAVTEAFTAADTNAQQSAFLQSINEPMIMFQDESFAAIYDLTQVETVTLDTNLAIGSAFVDALTENVFIADQATISQGYLFSVTEDSAINDILVPFFAAKQTRVEPINLNDSIQIAANFINSIAENLRPAANQTISAQFSSSIVEALRSNDVIAQAASFAASITEDSSVNDVLAIVRGFIFSITEDVSVNDVRTASVIFTASILESIRSGDANSTQSAFLQTITEGASILDAFLTRGWTSVNDSQLALWAAINDNQTTTWTDINGAQNPNWTPINNSQ